VRESTWESEMCAIRSTARLYITWCRRSSDEIRHLSSFATADRS